MDATFSNISHLRLDGKRPVAVLSLAVLTSLDRRHLDALAQIGITTLSELLHFEPVHRARVALAVARGAVGHDLDLEPYLDSVPADLSGLADLPVEAVRGVGQATGVVLRDEFALRTLADLADWSAVQEAERLVAEQARGFSEAASAPDELIPRIRGAAGITRARYASFVRESTPRLGLRLRPGGNIPDFVNQTLLQLFVRDPKNTPFNPDLGYAVLHEQTWRPLGLQLGEPLHSVGLSPGEVRKVAVIDWRQSLRASRAEDTQTAEQLNSLQVHQRALDEVVRTTAEEHQAGRTDTLAATGLGAGAGVASGAMVGAIGGAIVGGVTGVPIGALLGLAAGAIGGGGAAGAPTGGAAAPEGAAAGAAAGVPIGAALGGLGGTLTGALMGSALGSAAAAIGSSLLVSASGALGHVESASEGDRGIFGRLNQNITDVAAQKSSYVRSLRSSVVIDVSQAEQEKLTTYVIANNNRAHALSIVYFEMLNRYLVELRTARIDPLLFLPFSPLDFDFDLIASYWHVIRLGVSDPDLVASVDAILSSLDFFESGAGLATAADPDAVLERISVELLLPPSLTDPTAFSVACLLDNGSFDMGDGKLVSIAFSGVTFRFERTDRNDPLSRIVGFRVSSGLTAGANISLRVSQMNVLAGGSRKVIRNIELGTKSLPASSDATVDFDFAAREVVEQRETQQQELGLTIDRIVDHVRRRAYFFTRFVLLGLDSAELEDLLESLAVESSADNASIALLALIDPTPVGFVGGHIVFRLKREPRVFRIRELSLHDKVPVSPGMLRQIFPHFGGGADEAVRNQFTIVDEIKPVLDFIDGIAAREAEDREQNAVTREVALPASGVFAEAILGRSVAAETIDPTRYIAWDLPNPNQPPNIADLQAGGRGQPVPPLSATIDSGVLQIQQPTSLPDPSGFAGAFAALATANLFRDMSKSDVLGQTLSSLARVAETAAQQAGTLAGQAQQSALQAALGLAQDVAKGLSTVAGNSFGSLTELGGKLNAGLPPSPQGNQGGGGGGGGGGGRPTPRPPTPSQDFGTGQTSAFQPIRLDLRAFIPAPILGLIWSTSSAMH